MMHLCLYRHIIYNAFFVCKGSASAFFKILLPLGYKGNDFSPECLFWFKYCIRPSLPPLFLLSVGLYIFYHILVATLKPISPSCGCERPFQTQDSGYSDHLTKNNVIMYKKKHLYFLGCMRTPFGNGGQKLSWMCYPLCFFFYYIFHITLQSLWKVKYMFF